MAPLEISHHRSVVTRWPVSPTWIAVVFYTVNVVGIVSGIASGHRKGDITMRFQEKQTITFFSSNQLAMTALLGVAIYLLRRHGLGRSVRASIFWLVTGAAFFFLMLDESFQFHEGFDSRIFEAVGAGGKKNPRIDGLSTALYGLAAFVVCWTFRADILRFQPTFHFFCAGAVFLAVTSALNFGDAPPWRVVTEEASKLLGVCSFLVGHIAAFLGTLSEVRDRVGPGIAAPARGEASREVARPQAS